MHYSISLAFGNRLELLHQREEPQKILLCLDNDNLSYSTAALLQG